MFYSQGNHLKSTLLSSTKILPQIDQKRFSLIFSSTKPTDIKKSSGGSVIVWTLSLIVLFNKDKAYRSSQHLKQMAQLVYIWHINLIGSKYLIFLRRFSKIQYQFEGLTLGNWATYLLWWKWNMKTCRITVTLLN